MKTLFLSLSLVGLMLATGCGLDGPIPKGPNATATSTAAGEHSTGDMKTSETMADETADAGKSARETKRRGRRLDTPTEKTSEAAPGKGTEKSTEAAPGTVREKAGVGMGEKGRGYGGGIITEPVHVMWNAQELIVLQRIEAAMKFYKGSEGHAPRTQDEFMEKIIKENSIPLPTLPQGHRYFYDPNKEELLIEKPSDNP